MAEYKNWYLAGGSGMKDERKKLKLIILLRLPIPQMGLVP